MKHFKSNILLTSILGIGLISSTALYAQSDSTQMETMRGMGHGDMMSGGMMGDRKAMMGRCKDMMHHEGMHAASKTTADGTGTTNGQTTESGRSTQ